MKRKLTILIFPLALETWDRHVGEIVKGEPCRCRDKVERAP
jgi:hypothetical protein